MRRYASRTGAAGLVVALCVLTAGSAARAQSAATCDPAGFAIVQEALAFEPPPVEPTPFLDENGNPLPTPPPAPPLAQRSDFTTRAVSEMCTLPPALGSALEASGNLAPEQREVGILRALMEDPTLLVAACGPEGVGSLADVAAAAPVDRSARFSSTCRPGIEGLANGDEVGHLSVAELVLAAAVYAYLSGNGEPHAVELGRMLLGLGLTVPTTNAE